MLGKPHLRTLQRLDEPKTPTELAGELGYSLKHVSRTLSQLTRIGLATNEQKGRRKLYMSTENRAVERYRELTNRYPHIDFPELLTPSYLCVVYHLDEKRTADELTKLSRPSRATVYRVLKELRNRGMVKTEDDRYTVRGPYTALTEFARETAILAHRSKLREDFPGGKNHIVWNNDYEYIALLREVSRKSAENIENEKVLKENTTHDEHNGKYYLTGLEALEDYDLRFLTTSGYHVFYTKEDTGLESESLDGSAKTSLLPEDLACHTAVIQERSSIDQRYTLLFLAKFRDELREEFLKERAVHYDIAQKMDTLVGYLDSQGEVAQEDVDLPSWDEFERLAREYEVTTDDTTAEVR